MLDLLATKCPKVLMSEWDCLICINGLNSLENGIKVDMDQYRYHEIGCPILKKSHPTILFAEIKIPYCVRRV